MTTAARVENAQETELTPPPTSADDAGHEKDKQNEKQADGQECRCDAAAVAHEHQGAEVLRLYRYQPKDAEGRPLGGLQVVKYKDEQDLADQMAKQNSELVRLNRELKWKADKPAAGDVPADAETVAPAPRPRALDAAERARLAQEIVDPETIEPALTRAFEAIFGIKPKDLEELNRNMGAVRARLEGETWANNHPEFYRCAENAEMLSTWCRDRNLRFTQANLSLAYTKLKEAGLLLEAPIAAEATPPNGEAGANGTGGRIATSETTPPRTRTLSPGSSGLTRSQASGSGSGSGPRNGLTWADVDRMPIAEYERKYRTEPSFRKAVDALPPR